MSRLGQTTGDARKRLMAAQEQEGGFRIVCRACAYRVVVVNSHTPTNGLCVVCQPNERHWGQPVAASTPW